MAEPVNPESRGGLEVPHGLKKGAGTIYCTNPLESEEFLLSDIRLMRINKSGPHTASSVV